MLIFLVKILEIKDKLNEVPYSFAMILDTGNEVTAYK